MPRTSPILIVSALAASLALSSCGRKADLERPSAMPAPANGQNASEPVDDKPFILDGLIK